MNESFDSHSTHEAPDSHPESQKKKKLWKNLFILNLCVTILLVSIFWVPLKLEQIDGFLASPSVNQKKGGPAQPSRGAQVIAGVNPNLIAAQSIVIDATNEDHWTYFDFSRGRQVKIHDPSSLEWDLAFRRGKIISNGGATNKFGQAGLMDLGEVSFDAVDSVPLKDFVVDQATRTQAENSVLVNWYKYNYISHKLTARKNIYVMRTSDGKFAKIQFLSFYCANKQPGCIQMKYAYQDKGTKSFLKDNSGSFASPVVVESPNISKS
ncbi:MAG: HmuY family protein [Nitrospinae bacterium]|nr:HmuY family protein [Nitrospinota bacterium]